MRKPTAHVIILIGIITALILGIAPASAQAAPPGVIEAAIAAANAAKPELGRPDNWSWEQFPATTSSALGCELVVGSVLPAPVTPYRVRLTYNEGRTGAGIYTVYVSADTSVIQLCDAKFGTLALATATPEASADPSVTLTPVATLSSDACTLTPIGAYSNVRSRPELDAPLANVVYENNIYPVTGRNMDDTWYLIELGWISKTVVEVAGNCIGVPVSFAVIYTDGPEIEPNNHPCPPDYAGYMPPRIQLGDPYASVQQGGVPNRLRVAPSTSAQVVGEVPPGGSFNFINDGPACNEGYVWWQVSYGEIGGWTAESDYRTKQYFLDPWRPVQQPGDEQADAVLLSNDAGGAVLFSPSANILASTDYAQGETVVNLYNMLTRHNTPYATLTHNSPVSKVIFHTSQDNIATADFGSVNFWELSVTAQYMQSRVVSDVSANTTGYGFDINPDWSAMATTSCAEYGDGGCLTSEIRIWDVSSGTLARTMQQTGFNPYDIEFRIDGTTLMAASYDRVTFWDTVNGALITSLPTTQTAIYDTTFSPDGILVAVSACGELVTNITGAQVCNSGVIEIWDVTTMVLKRSINITGTSVMSIDFSPDNLYLVGGVEQDLTVWAVETGDEVTARTGHEGRIMRVAFSPVVGDVYMAASVDINNDLWLWEIDVTTTTTGNG